VVGGESLARAVGRRRVMRIERPMQMQGDLLAQGGTASPTHDRRGCCFDPVKNYNRLADVARTGARASHPGKTKTMKLPTTEHNCGMLQRTLSRAFHARLRQPGAAGGGPPDSQAPHHGWRRPTRCAYSGARRYRPYRSIRTIRAPDSAKRSRWRAAVAWAGDPLRGD